MQAMRDGFEPCFLLHRYAAFCCKRRATLAWVAGEYAEPQKSPVYFSVASGASASVLASVKENNTGMVSSESLQIEPITTTNVRLQPLRYRRRSTCHLPNNELFGVWRHSSGDGNTVYCLSSINGSSDKCKFELITARCNRWPGGVVVTGVLISNGEWFQGGLVSAGSVDWGILRVRHHGPDTVVSNFKDRAEDEWGPPFVLQRNVGMTTNEAMLRQHIQAMHEDDESKDICVRLMQGQEIVLEIRVHSLLLQRCEYFAALLSQPFKESEKDCIEISDVECIPFQQMIKHLYMIDFDIQDAAAAWSLYEAAQYFQLYSLAELCESWLMQDLASDDSHECASYCLAMIEHASRVNARRVVQEALWLLHVVGPTIAMQAVLCANKDTITELVRHDCLLVPETMLAKSLEALGGLSDYDAWEHLRLPHVDDAVLSRYVDIFEELGDAKALARLCRAWACKSGAMELPVFWTPRFATEVWRPVWEFSRDATLDELFEADRRPQSLWFPDVSAAPSEVGYLSESTSWHATAHPYIGAGKLFSWSFQFEFEPASDVQSIQVCMWMNRIEYLSSGQPFYDEARDSNHDQTFCLDVFPFKPLRLVVDTRVGRVQCGGKASAKFDVTGFGGPWTLTISFPVESRVNLVDCRVVSLEGS